MKKYFYVIVIFLPILLYSHDSHNLIDIYSTYSIPLDIRYATKNNFTKTPVYPKAYCYLRKEVAVQLSKVQADLKKRGYSLKIYDGYRPRSIQYKFWEICPDSRYVANPKKGSRHNRGAAVDLTIIDKEGKELDMGTDFDDFTKKAHRNCISLSKQAQSNRKLLENIMEKHGFIGLSTEWWHFDYKKWTDYELLDIPFEDLINSPCSSSST